MSETERRIFRFFDGSDHRLADPLELMRKLRRHPCDFDKVEAMRKDAPNDDLADESWLELVAAIRDVFEVKPLDQDGRGLTEGETYDLLNDFGEYLDTLKKNTSVNPISPPSSEPSACQGSVEPTNMSDLSVSG
jgi:hypothetical protein